MPCGQSERKVREARKRKRTFATFIRTPKNVA